MAKKESIESEINEEVKETKEKKKPKKKSILGRSKKDKSKEKIAELEAELAEQKDKFLRVFAEFENFRKRTNKERIELIATAGQSTMKAILPVLDDFDRAKQSAEDENSTEPFSEGVILVYNKLNSVLQAKGLKAMETTGEEFNPEHHEAVTEIPAPSEDMKGKVIDTIERGYYLNDKIIRFPKVVVGK